MSELLKAKQKLAKGRYIISKALMSGDDGASYLATDTQLDNSACVVREFYPKNKLSEEEQAKYDERFQSSMLILTQFDHPNLTKIYDSFTEKDRYYVVMEHVDGITLQTLLSMSVKPLPAKQVLGWMLQVCQAMQYMHNRPKPFIFDALDANNIMIDQDENIRLINYGLSRFFSDADSISFSSSPDLISKEIKLMGRTMAFLLTRHEVSDLGFDPGDVEVSDDLVRLINRLLADGNGGIRDFDKLQQELNKILNPPKVKERKTDEDGKTFKSFDIGRRLEDLLEKFLGQPVWLIGCEVLAVIGICITVYFTMNPTITERAQSAVYVACGNELHLYSAATKDPLGRIHMKYNVSSMLASRNGIKLYCSLNDSSHIAVVNAKTNRYIDTFPVGKGPGKMVMDGSESWLYVLHSKEGLVTAVQASHDPLPDLATANFSKEKATGMYSVGSDAYGLAIFKAASHGAEGQNSTTSGDVVICSSSIGNTVDAFTNPPMESIASQFCKSAGPIAINSDGTTAAVGQIGTSQVEFFRTSDLRSQGTALQTGGSELRQLIFSPSKQELWCVNGSGNVGVISTDTHKLLGVVKMEGKPVSAVWNTLGSKPELWVATTTPNKLAIVDVDTKIVAQSIDLGGTPSDLCLVNAPASAK